MFRVFIPVFLLLTMFGCDVPRDPNGTAERVRGGTMRVGISESPPWTTYEDDEAEGIEVELVTRFAEAIRAEIEWTSGGESELMESLEKGRLDLVIGGLAKATPWKGRIGMTRPYLTTQDQEHVMAVPPGENRWLLELEKFLYRERGRAMALYQEAPSA